MTIIGGLSHYFLKPVYIKSLMDQLIMKLGAIHYVGRERAILQGSFLDGFAIAHLEHEKM